MRVGSYLNDLKMQKNADIKISAADDTAIKAAIVVIQTKLTPYLMALTDKERRGGFRMGDKSIAFVEKGGSYGNQFAAEMPASIKLADLATDVTAVSLLNSYAKPLTTLLRGVEDTVLIAGTDAMEASVHVYSAIKLASVNGVPGAQAAYNDMKERFPGAHKKVVTPVTPVTPPVTT